MEKEDIGPMLPVHGQTRHDHTVSVDIWKIAALTLSSGSTVYESFTGTTGSNESYQQIAAPRDGYLKNLRAYATANNLITGSAGYTGSCVFVLRTGSGESSLTVAYTGSGFTAQVGLTGSRADTTHVVPVLAGTLVNMKTVCTGVSGSFTSTICTVEFWS